jgi:hypothetical protein
MHEPLRAQDDETSGNIAAFPLLAADELLEIGTAVTSVVLSLDEQLTQTNTSCVPKFCYQYVHFVLFDTCLPE